MGDGAMQVPGPAGRSFLGGSDASLPHFLPKTAFHATPGLGWSGWRRPKGTGVLLCLPGRTGTRSMGCSVITPALREVLLRRAARVEGQNREARPRC